MQRTYLAGEHRADLPDFAQSRKEGDLRGAGMSRTTQCRTVRGTICFFLFLGEWQRADSEGSAGVSMKQIIKHEVVGAV